MEEYSINTFLLLMIKCLGVGLFYKMCLDERECDVKVVIHLHVIAGLLSLMFSDNNLAVSRRLSFNLISTN